MANLTDNLISYWAFNENDGSVVSDQQKTNSGIWNGTLGSQWTTGKLGASGGNFNGTDNYVKITAGNLLAALASSSISLWMKTTTTPPAGGSAIYAERAASGNDIWKVELAQGKQLRFTHRDDANTLDQPTGGITTNTNGLWHHLVITKSGTTINGYVDNVLDINGATLTGTDTMTNANVAWIGADVQDGAAWFNGQIDEVGIWNRALTATEVSQLYNSGIGLYYPFTQAPIYKNQGRLERLVAKVTGVSVAKPRFSDYEATLFADLGSGQKRKSDEIAYYQGKNGDGATVNRKMSDAGNTYWEANGASGQVRADQAEHVFYKNGSFT